MILCDSPNRQLSEVLRFRGERRWVSRKLKREKGSERGRLGILREVDGAAV